MRLFVYCALLLSSLTALADGPAGPTGGNTASYAQPALQSLDFSKPELYASGNLSITNASNLPSSGGVAYTSITVTGTYTVSWPSSWSPNHTNSVTLTNGVVAFRAYGTNVYAASYQP